MYTETSSRWVSLNDVCRLTSLSRTTINNWRERGEFALPIEVGGRVTFLREEVLAWMEERERNRPASDRLGRARAA